MPPWLLPKVQPIQAQPSRQEPMVAQSSCSHPLSSKNTQWALSATPPSQEPITQDPQPHPFPTIGRNQSLSYHLSPTSPQEPIVSCPSAPPAPHLGSYCQPSVGHTFQALIQVLEYHSDDLHDGQNEGAEGQRACVIPLGRGSGQWSGQASSTPTHPYPQPTLGPT